MKHRRRQEPQKDLSEDMTYDKADKPFVSSARPEAHPWFTDRTE